MKIIKKNGTEELWSDNKLKNSIMAACRQSGISEDRIREVTDIVSEKVMKQLSGMETATSYKIRDCVLKELDAIENAVADSWRKYEMTKN